MTLHQAYTLSPKIILQRDTGLHSLSNLEWWYCSAYVDGEAGSKYAVIISFFNSGIIPFIKGHYLIFSLINLKDGSRKNFSLFDRNLVLNMNLTLFPYYLLYCPFNKEVWNQYLDHLKFNINHPHKLIGTSFIQKHPVRLIYGNNSLVFMDEKGEQFNVHVKEGDVDINLNFIPAKPVSLIGKDGKPNQLYYYSFTNNKVYGYINSDSLTENVTGKGWFDHQWGYSKGLLSKHGWNWFSLQLEDGRELLINEFGSYKTGKTFSQMANLIEKDGSLKYTTTVSLEPQDFWESPITGAIYPQNWCISIPGFSMNLKISSDFPAQEIPTAFPLQAIWEGASSASGYEALPGQTIKSIHGRGFIELVGYANYECY